MIPKKIHYCWFGGAPLDELALSCINSWKKYCPDYEIIQWNEMNYDINKNKYMKEAYRAKKWGFVPDYARLDIIYEHGGVYLDTDVEIIRSLDDLIENDAFAGLEGPGRVALGLGFGATKGFEPIKDLRDMYENLSFINDDGSLNLIPSPVIQSAKFKDWGLSDQNTNQKINGFMIYKKSVMCPKDYDTGRIRITKDTYMIHHYNASWKSEELKESLELMWKLSTILPKTFARYISRSIAVLKYRGVKGLLYEIKNKVRKSLYEVK